MSKQDVLKYLDNNLEKVFINLAKVFSLDGEEIKVLVMNLVKAYDYNTNLNEKAISDEIFSEQKLEELKKTLLSVGLSEEEIKNIIVKSPMIILYSTDLSNIYYLYKNRKYYGYTIRENEKVDTYLLNSNLPSNIVSNNHITDIMFEYYGVKEPTKEALDKIICNYKKKNYYFKKPEK